MNNVKNIFINNFNNNSLKEKILNKYNNIIFIPEYSIDNDLNIYKGVNEKIDKKNIPLVLNFKNKILEKELYNLPFKIIELGEIYFLEYNYFSYLFIKYYINIFINTKFNHGK